MAAEIIKVYRETMPDLRLIGKCYGDAQRQNGSFGHKWGEWHQNGWFDELEKLGPIKANDDGYLGVMHVENGMVAYWIGMFFAPGTAVPEGFDSIDISAFDVVTCWVYGSAQSGELYGMDVHNRCVAEAAKLGLVRKEDDWCFERYNCPRFVSPDDKGNVILDYAIAIC